MQEVLAKDGVIGLFGRGLKTKILANGLQGMLFTVSALLIIPPDNGQILRYNIMPVVCIYGTTSW